MYKPSDLTGPKEVNHDVMFREGQNLEVCTRLECSSWSSKRHLPSSSSQTLRLVKI